MTDPTKTDQKMIPSEALDSRMKIYEATHLFDGRIMKICSILAS